MRRQLAGLLMASFLLGAVLSDQILRHSVLASDSVESTRVGGIVQDIRDLQSRAKRHESDVARKVEEIQKQLDSSDAKLNEGLRQQKDDLNQRICDVAARKVVWRTIGKKPATPPNGATIEVDFKEHVEDAVATLSHVDLKHKGSEDRKLHRLYLSAKVVDIVKSKVYVKYIANFHDNSGNSSEERDTGPVSNLVSASREAVALTALF
jgi:hypothetical protein